jgi:tellurite resistance protein TerC
MLAGMIERFVYLKVGLAAVLVFVGAKMLLGGVVEVPIWASLLAICSMIGASILVSLRATANRGPVPLEGVDPAENDEDAQNDEDPFRTEAVG